MLLQEISYIQAIAEYKSLSKASRMLYLSQPSLSQSLAKVEERYGKKLFLRNADGMTLTAFGQRYLETAMQIQARYQKLLVNLDELHELKRGKITFGIPQNLATCLLPAALSEFLSMYPDIQVQYMEHNSAELDELMLEGKIEFSIMHYKSAHDMILHEHLLDDPFYLVVPENHPFNLQLAKKAVTGLSKEDLQLFVREPFILIESHHILRQCTDMIMERAGLVPEKIRFTTKSMETAKRLVSVGLGVTFLPHSYLELYSGAENLTYYPLEKSLEAYWEMIVSYPKQKPLMRASREFIRVLKRTL